MQFLEPAAGALLRALKPTGGIRLVVKPLRVIDEAEIARMKKCEVYRTFLEKLDEFS
jgi:hypothetical protein